MIEYFAERAPNGRYVQCIALEAPLQEAPIPGDPRNTMHPVAAPPASWEGTTPSKVLYLIDGEEKWVETATLEAIKIRKNAEIDSKREEANRTYFDFDEGRIACSDVSWKDIMSTSAYVALTHSMPPNWVGGWKTMDKGPNGETQYVDIPDVATWTLFIEAMVNRGLAHFDKSEKLKVRLKEAQTPDEVEALHW